MFYLRSIYKYSTIHNFSFFKKHSKNTVSLSESKSGELSANKAALRQELHQCRKEIKKCRRWNLLPSPKSFERAAMLYRQTKSYESEIKICQLYISLVEESLSKRKFNKKKIKSKATILCDPLSTRLNKAKILLDNQGVNVQYL